MHTIDDTIFEWVISERSDLLTSVFMFFTRIADWWVVFLLGVVLAGAFALYGKRGYGFLLLALLFVNDMLSAFLKLAIGRERPDETFHLVDVFSQLSFPSGHASRAAAFYGMLVIMVWAHSRSTRLRFLVCIVGAFLVTGVAVSRVYLGVHYPSDVVAGVMIGALMAIGFYSLYTTRKVAPSDRIV